VTFEVKKKRTEEDSVSCPMKYSTDVICRSDSLAVISYRDINQFTYVNLSYAVFTKYEYGDFLPPVDLAYTIVGDGKATNLIYPDDQRRP
jgi:hypothetical protein